MPAYNFKPRFAASVSSGTKRQTIRAIGKLTPRVGQTAYLYQGLRTTPAPILLGLARIIDVKPITIDAEISFVHLDGAQLYGQALVDFAKADGFDSVTAFFAFFMEIGRSKRFHGRVIYWSPLE